MTEYFIHGLKSVCVCACACACDSSSLCCKEETRVCVCLCVRSEASSSLRCAEETRQGSAAASSPRAGTAALLSRRLLERSVPLLTDKHRDRIPLSAPYQAICTLLHNFCHNLLGKKAANLFIWQPLCPRLLPGQVFCGTAISDRQHGLSPGEQGHLQPTKNTQRSRRRGHQAHFPPVLLF